ncbi:MAG: 4-hydroxy-tetrahydrodipicolinate reductase [Candidatus Bathyarchaeota archaeon]
MRNIKICVVGATGRMGSTLIKEALIRGGFKIVGAVAAPGEETIGKSLFELGIANLDLKVVGADRLKDALKDAEVYISFTTPQAEVSNIPVVAEHGVKIVVGTTGLNDEQRKIVEEAVKGKVPAIFSPNFSLGVNILFKVISQLCKILPAEYDVSVVEAHHKGKVDAPSGTAEKILSIVSSIRGYKEKVYGRTGFSKRKPEEIEVFSVRGGGIPGIHELIVAGPYEMIKIEHLAFSRSVFAQGALYAAEWLYRQSEPKIYTMEDVLENPL